MSYGILKTIAVSLPKVLVFSFIFALVAGFLHPMAAKATVSSPSIDAAPVNLTTTPPISLGYAGDTRNPTITVEKQAFAQFPSITSNEYYYASLYNIDTGVLVSEDTIYPDGSIQLGFPSLIPVGRNNYQVILSHDTQLPQAGNLAEIVNVIGKSKPFIYERQPITISLTTTQSQFGENGTNLHYEVNQEINDDSYSVHIFNMKTGKLQDAYTDRTNDTIGVKFPYDDSNPYIAILSKHQMIEGTYTPTANLSNVVDVIATSNVVSLEKAPWKVSLQGEGWTVVADHMNVNITEGGGEYATYVVDNATGNIIWDSEDSENGSDASIANPNYPDVSWATAYVARSYKERSTGEPIFPRPQTYNELTDIIADSKGYSKGGSGVDSLKQVAGGINPNEKCPQGCHGDPINTATGEFFDSKNDIKTVGTGLIPNVERSFSTTNKDTLNLLGYGWRSNYEMRIVADNSEESFDPNILTTRKIWVENENSSVSSFYRKDDGSFEGATKTRATLKFNSSSQTFSFIRDNKESFIFNSAGKLIKIENDRGQIINLTYLNGKLNTVADTKGNVLTFAYNTNNLISTVTAQNGRTVTYTYNTAKQLTKVINASGVTYNYTYDTLRRMKTFSNELGGVATQTYNTNNQVTKQVDPLGRIMTFAYVGDFADGTTQIKYPNNRIVEETYKRGQLVQKVENYGQSSALTWRYAYNSENELISTINPDLSSTTNLYDSKGNLTNAIDGRGNSTTFTYDGKNNLLTIKDAYGNITTNVYDSDDNLISSTTPLGEKTTFTYNPDKSVASLTDARGNAANANPASYTSAYSYIANGLPSVVSNPVGGTVSMTYNSYGDMTEVKDARGYKTTMEYNALGLLTKAVDPLQNQTAMTYDQMGNVLTSTNAKGALTTYTYDVMGNKLTETNAKNEVSTYTYNSLDKPETITFPDGSTQTITYDVFGRPIQLKDQLLRITTQEWDVNSRVTALVNPDGGRTEYTYDGAGNVMTVKTAKGALTAYSYDKMNRPVKMTDALGRSTITEYDANGRVIKKTSADGTVEETTYDAVGNIVITKDEAGNSKAYTYDALSRKTSFTTELGQNTSYSYDASSNLVSQTRPDASVVTYIYDAKNLLISIDYAGTDEDITYTYDELGRKATETKGSSPVVTYTYDNLNRVLTRGTATNTVSYSYDNVGNLKSLTYPSGRVVTYDYDKTAQLTQLNTSGVGINSFVYNNRGLVTTSNLANGVTESKAYDADNQLISTDVTKAGGSLYKRTQSYNLVGDVAQKGTDISGAALGLENFTYDPMSRLTEQKTDTDGRSLNSYAYNSTGNLTSVNSKAQTFDKAGKITKTGSSSINYDARNNRANVADTVDVNKNIEYQWGQNNLLTNTTIHKNSTASTIGYTYSADSLLQTRTEGNVTKEFIWDVSREIPVMLSDGTYEYIYSKSRVPFAQIEISTGLVTYLHSDLTGSITASTDINGALVGTVDYSPYGKPTGSLLSNFGYAGEWVDKITGYSYLRARWLDVSTGTFLSEDPLVQMTNNAFGYTEGNPITQIDPLGLMINTPKLWEALYQTDWNAVGQDIKNATMNIWSNSGNISATLSIASLFAVVGGAPAAVGLGTASMIFSVLALTYDFSSCIGLIKGAECNWIYVSLDIAGISTGGFAQWMGRGGRFLSSIEMTKQFSLSVASFLAGFTGFAMGIAANASPINTNGKKEKCPQNFIQKMSLPILL